MKTQSRILLVSGFLILILTPFVCRESLRMMVETDETEEVRIKNILHYIKEDSIKNKPIIYSLQNDLNAEVTDNTGMYLLGASIISFGIGITLFVVGYERHKSAKKQN